MNKYLKGRFLWGLRRRRRFLRLRLRRGLRRAGCVWDYGFDGLSCRSLYRDGRVFHARRHAGRGAVRRRRAFRRCSAGSSSRSVFSSCYRRRGLVTGNCLMPIACLSKKISFASMMRNICAVYFANFAGALFSRRSYSRADLSLKSAGPPRFLSRR